VSGGQESVVRRRWSGDGEDLVGWLQPFAKYQPITPMVDAVRALLVGSTADLSLALAWSALLLLVFTPLAVARYRRP
jgi:ABC-2 type transport system permease protein